MAEVRWSQAAREEFANSAEYIERRSPAASSKFVLSVLAAVERVGSFPLSGRIVPESEDATVREVFAFRYRIMYQVHSGYIEVIAVVHGAREDFSLGSRLARP